MKIFRLFLILFMSLWILLALGYAFVTVVWTQATMTRLYTPEITGLESHSESAGIEIYAADGTRMYRRDYHFGGRLSRDSVDLEIPIYLLNTVRASQLPDEGRFTWWQRALFRLEKIDPNSLESFIREYYANSLTEISRLSGFQKELLQYYVMKKLQGGYSDQALYTFFFDAVHYAPDIQGITGAARAYFDKAFDELNLLELCFLVAKATTNPQESVQYHDKIARQFLSTLYQSGRINSADYRHYLESRLEFTDRDYPVIEPTLISAVLDNLAVGGIVPGTGEMTLRTHYNIRATEAAKSALAPLYEKDPLLQAAFVMLNTRTGGIEVALGSRVENSTRNRALSAKRQMGSTFKPVVYATAFQQGALPSEHIIDKQYTFTAGGTRYSPGNYKNVFLGSVPMRYGLVYSLNNATVHLAQRTGLSRISRNASAMGFKGDLSPYFSLALGAYGTSPLSVAEMFGTLATLGMAQEYTLLETAVQDGQSLDIPKKEPVPVFDEAAAFQTLYIMQDVCLKGTAKSAGMLPGTAAKTGTTDQSKDLWTVAIAYPYVIVLWLGYDDYSPMDDALSGGNVVAPVVAAFQKEYFGSAARFEIPVPEDIRFETVRTATGLIAGKGRGPTYVEAFREGHLPGKE